MDDIMNIAQIEIVRDLVNNMATFSKGEACPFNQTGYDFVTDRIDFYLHPAEYTEVVRSIY
jgi:hypothetical protein